jgi:hypothetical protein
VASGVSLLAKAAWLHGRVLQRVHFGEVLCASALVLGLGWFLHSVAWATLLGPGLLPCLLALGLASLAVLAIGATWDTLLSRRSDRDSLVSILAQRWGRRA